MTIPWAGDWRKTWFWIKQGLRPRKRLAIVEAGLIGLVSGLSAVVFKYGVGFLGTWRLASTEILPPWIALPLIGLCFGLLSGWLVERFGKEAAGSGIPQVKAALALFPMPLNFRVAVVKLISGTIALGSGITLGRQGPTVQIGAAVAAHLSQWVPTSPDYRRQMIAAGAGAGLAAAFNAPIAGVLFVVEELLQDVSGFTLGTAILASFIGAVVSRVLGGGTLNLDLVLNTSHSSFTLPELPFYLLLGVLAGVGGAWFCRGIFVSLQLYRRLPPRLPLKIGLAAMLSGMVMALLPLSFRNHTGLRESIVAGNTSWELAAIAFVAQFFLTLLAFGSTAPGGLFAPSLILGSSLGALVGHLAQALLHLGSPNTYALAGMGAFFSAVSKVPITAIVIVFEMTTDFNLVLPLMIGCVTAYLVADQLFPRSLYDRILEWNGIHLEKKSSGQTLLQQLKARDLMQQAVESLDAKMTIEEAVQAFSRSHHRGFPVVENNKLVGIITQTDLTLYTQRQLNAQMPISRIMTPRPVTVSPATSLADVLYLLNRYQLSRLPVTEGTKLVGIITRSDLIRAEANQLTLGSAVPKSQAERSYVVYRTCGPTIGKGRLLVPLANPQTAPFLLQMAASIARDRQYEIECLQVITLPRSQSPAETTINTSRSRRLLRRAENLGREWKIPVHTQVRVAHDTATAILETIKERDIDVLLMGWRGAHLMPNAIFSDTVDTLIRQASCEVVLVKLAEGLGEVSLQVSPHCLIPTFNRWLIPIAGGPNTQWAMQILPSLIALGHSPTVELAQVFHPSNYLPDTSTLEQAAYQLSQQLNRQVIAIPLKSGAVAEALIHLAQTDRCDVVVLGASREGLLQQAVKGNIPEAIARGVNSTVILVRTAQ